MKRLFRQAEGHEVRVGDVLTDSRGERWTVTGWREPQHEGSTGRVYVTCEGMSSEFFPGVFDLFWEEDDA